MTRRRASSRDPEPARDALRRFVYRVDELRDTRLLRTSNLDAKLTVKGFPGAFEITFLNPDEDDLKSFILTFRPFVSQGEPVHAYTIFRTAFKHITEEDLVVRLVIVRDAWKTAMSEGHGYLLLEGREDKLTPPYVMDLFINGFYFHSDRDKERELEELSTMGITRWMLIAALEASTACILGARHWINVALRDGLVSNSPVRDRPPKVVRPK